MLAFWPAWALLGLLGLLGMLGLLGLLGLWGLLGRLGRINVQGLTGDPDMSSKRCIQSIGIASKYMSLDSRPWFSQAVGL